MKKRVLFVCIHNSARSQMAEAFLQEAAGDRFEVHSAGLEQGKLNPVVVEAMGEIGIDISHKNSDTVAKYLDGGMTFDYVITVCDAANGEKCPVFPGDGTRLGWVFTDPAGLAGSHEEKLANTRLIREEIKERIAEFVAAGK